MVKVFCCLVMVCKQKYFYKLINTATYLETISKISAVPLRKKNSHCENGFLFPYLSLNLKCIAYSSYDVQGQYLKKF
jgi:hypothetical protein